MSEQISPNVTPASTSRGRPKDPAKRQAILEAAKHLFLSHGFTGTSMDAVASEAGVSKLTVYSHFSDKETLFSAAIEAKCCSQMPVVMFTLEQGVPVAEMLQKIGEAFLDMLYHEDSLKLMRLISAVGAQDQTMANLFYEAGPQRTRNEMIRFLNRACELGQLQVADTERASELFFGMLQGGCTHIQIMLGCSEPPGKPEIRLHVAEVVRVFTRAYRPVPA
ncbi:TetR/AcrR family transcriptional regulator [Microbulbifer hydrolyticus]|uniref:TetR family transcriptional regulator n=1 Tax=Microbulbifer hydrolyticus TaxID=48074 RepID=A0A6P1TBB2_9GAMM|nr:TetR/AcrR family transcriptional regulator [Microbulbifer hydrolyticus]MBB5212425.1 TetR/AcrR family transcriptional repressor of mexJK operon [Microbulbifer hydrolyticus]QHQ40058.1 TetR family transcriptional regulator [Microbulbifer hydrolyticus]